MGRLSSNGSASRLTVRLRTNLSDNSFDLGNVEMSVAPAALTRIWLRRMTDAALGSPISPSPR